jgi:hypothetical protein
MLDLLSDTTLSFAALDVQEKREYLSVLSDVVWDIETELARAKAERAALMSSLQQDLDAGGR